MIFDLSEVGIWTAQYSICRSIAICMRLNGLPVNSNLIAARRSWSDLRVRVRCIWMGMCKHGNIFDNANKVGGAEVWGLSTVQLVAWAE